MLGGENAGLPADDCVGCDLRLFADAGLPTDDGVVADSDAAGETGLRGDHDVTADGAVVRDVNQVIELDSIGYGSDTQGRAIDAAVRADFDIVADVDGADLREFFVMVSSERKAEAVRADDRSGVDDDTSADAHAVIERDARMQSGLSADGYAASDATSGADLTAFGDDCFVSDDYVGADETAGGNLRGRSNNGGGVNERRGARLRIERSEAEGECSTRTFDGDDGPGARVIERERRDQAAGLRSESFRGGFRIREE